MADLLILRDDVFLRHDPGPGHPENAARLLPTLAELDAHPPAGTRTAAPRPATREELHRVHGESHVDRVEATGGRAFVRLDPDTATSARSWEAARLAAGAVVQAAESVAGGDAAGALCLVRPPGHHAERDEALGFCLFNNVAVAAAHALAELECRRVLVLDPDVHHGNGTQHSFEERAEVLYVSSHRWPFYPGTGAVEEIGRGAGAGFTLNLPLPAGAGDADLLACYRQLVDPIVRAWRPDLILVSAGFDTWQRDPIGGLAVTERGFSALASLFRRWADECCPGRLVWALEGGYDPAGVLAGVRAALAASTGRPPDEDALEVEGTPRAPVLATVERARRLLVPYWPTLRG